MRHALVCGALLCLSVWAEGRKVKGQYFLEADKIEYKSKEKEVIATGHVEIFRKRYMLKADRIVYNKQTNKVVAEGNVFLVKPNGEEFHAKSLELDDDLKEMVASEFKARLSDNNMFTANTATALQDKILFDKATYSPCEICKTRYPQWQVRALSIDYEKQKDTVFVNNFFDLYGIPVFYLPYIRVASYDSPPRSGFLLPNNFKYNSIYGFGVSIPYYLRVNDSNDFTYTPMITSKKQILHSANYRFMLQEGHTNNIYAEYIKSGRNKLSTGISNEFYIKGNFVHSISDKLMFNSNVEHVSHKSYLKNYHAENRNYLRSFAELNYLDDVSRFNGATQYFQDLRSANYGHTDITVAPFVEYDRSIVYGESKCAINVEAASLTKRKHGSIEQANTTLSWYRNYRYSNHVIDVYAATDLSMRKFVKADDQNDDRNRNYLFATAVPEFATTWKYPLVLVNDNSITQLAPLVKLIALPSSIYNRNIINEDSQEIDITDSNVFDINRYPGEDRLEDGIRLAYGLTGAGYFHNASYPSYGFVLGQNYRFKKSNEYSIYSGLKNTKVSDYVGRLSFKTFSIVDLHYMFQIDKSDYKVRKNEIGATFDFDIPDERIHKIVLDTKWSLYNYKRNIDNIRQSITVGGTVYLLKEWYLGGSMIQNITKRSSQLIEVRGNLGYSGQCTNIKFSVIKNNTKDATRKIIKGGFSYSIEVHLKNLN